VHPIKEGRRVPLKQLMKRLDISKYNAKTPFREINKEISEVKILLKQHAGNSSTPIVNKFDKVTEGQLIAEVEPDKLGARIHSSIDGIVKEFNKDFIIISKK